MSHEESCQVCAARPGVCPMCLGTTKVTVPSITDKIAFHLMNAPNSGLGLVPAEVTELGEVLGLIPRTHVQATGDTPCGCGITFPHSHLQEPPDERPDPV